MTESSAPRSPSSARPVLGRILRYALSLGLLAWMASRVEWSDARNLDQLDWRFALPAFLLAGLAYPLQACRWHTLLRAQSFTLPASWVHRVFWIGQFYNAFLPGGVAGDAVRFFQVDNQQPARRAAAAATLLADRFFGLTSLLALAILALALHLGSRGGPASLESMLAAGTVAFGTLLMLSWSLACTTWWQPLIARLVGPARANAWQEAAQGLARSPGALSAAALLSVVVWLLDFAAVSLLARSVGFSADPLTLTVAAAAAYLATILPISVGGHGVREVTLVGTLGLLGVHAGQESDAALLAVAFLILSVFWSLPGAFLRASRPLPTDTSA